MKERRRKKVNAIVEMRLRGEESDAVLLMSAESWRRPAISTYFPLHIQNEMEDVTQSEEVSAKGTDATF